MKGKIEKLIINALVDYNEELENPAYGNPDEKTRLYSSEGGMDSIALVGFIADLEERLAVEFNKDIILADERAMSQKRSPFLSVQLLANYIENLLLESEE